MDAILADPWTLDLIVDSRFRRLRWCAVAEIQGVETKRHCPVEGLELCAKRVFCLAHDPALTGVSCITYQ